jgi:hypothetical protein
MYCNSFTLFILGKKMKLQDFTYQIWAGFKLSLRFADLIAKQTVQFRLCKEQERLFWPGVE